MSAIQNCKFIYKDCITKKIINTKIHTIGNKDIFMNKYKFKEELSEKTKSVENDFAIDEKVNEFVNILKNVKDVQILLLSKDINLLKCNSLEDGDIVLHDNIDEFFEYPQAFEDDEKQKLELEILDIIKEINGINFAIEILDIKKAYLLKKFDIQSALQNNDKLSNMKEKLSKLKDKLKGVVVKIKIIEEEFVDDFNRLAMDIREKRLTTIKNMDMLTEKYSKVVVKEYKIQAILSLISNIFNGVEKQTIIDTINQNEDLKPIIGEEFEEVVVRLSDVGANI